METGQLGDPQSAESGSYAFSGATWTLTSRLAGIRSPSQSARLSSMAHSEAFHCGVSDRPRRLAPLREPHLLRLRPTSLRSQDISHLLTGVFRNLYSADVIGEDVSSNLIKARGSKNARHEQFVDELQQVRRLAGSRAGSGTQPRAGTGRRGCLWGSCQVGTPGSRPSREGR